MGNPHAVIFIDDPAADLRALAEAYGRGIEHDSLLPRDQRRIRARAARVRGTENVEFARVRQGLSGTGINLVVWERGCGITLACGTGACATVVAACFLGRPGRT